MLESGGLVQDIQEKQPYTSNRMDEFASSGTYYFSSGELMMEAFRNTVDMGLDFKGEYYVSLSYKHLIAKGLPVLVHEIEHFMQWGTPEDLDEYSTWSETFRNLMRPRDASPPAGGATVIPMAGLGKRFSREGYTLPKPPNPGFGKTHVRPSGRRPARDKAEGLRAPEGPSGTRPPGGGDREALSGRHDRDHRRAH